MPWWDLPRGKIFYEVHEIASSRSLVLIHGNLGGAVWWRPLLKVLERREASPSAKALVVEWRGSGRADPPAALADLRLEHIAQDIAAVIKNILPDEAPILVGHSLGGMLAILVAIAEKQSCGGLLVINSLPLNGYQTSAKKLALLERMQASRKVCAEAMNVTLDFSHPIDPEIFSEIVDTAFATASENWRWLPQILAEFNATAKIAEVDCRLHVVHGQRDSIVQWASSAEIADGAPKGKLILLPEHGHSLNIESPTKLAALLERMMLE